MADRWMGHKIFMTGASGFIGGEIAQALVKAGADVRCLLRRPERAGRLTTLGCTIVPGDVTRPETIDVGDANTVIHGAAWVAFGVPRGKRQRFWETNVKGTENVLESAAAAGVRHFCHFSSIAAIGVTPAGLYSEERVTDGRVPLYKSYYEETKHAAHLLVIERAGKMRTTIPMPGVVLGSGGDTAALFKYFGHPLLRTVRRDNPTGYVHVKDVVDGVLLMLQKGNGPYILVDQNLTLSELFDLCEKASGRPAPKRALRIGTLKAAAAVTQTAWNALGKVPPLSLEMVRALEVPMTYSSERARKELGWKPDLVAWLTEDFGAITGAE